MVWRAVTKTIHRRESRCKAKRRRESTMDQVEYTSLLEAFNAMPDPRAARGKRYPWPLLLVLISAALVSGQPHGRAIGQWVREHAEPLRSALDWSDRHWPSEATLRRVLRAVDVDALERCLRRIALPAS